MDVIFWTTKVIFTMALLTCPLVCLYWVFKPPDYFWTEHKRISTAIYAGGFLFFLVVIGVGVDLYLWFIPDNWTFETDDGHIDAARGTIAAFLAFVITGCLTIVLEEACREKHRQQTEENIKRDIERNKIRLNSAASENDRGKILAEFRAEKTKLNKLNWQDRLTPVQGRKLFVLRGLLDELEEGLEQ